jgi:hypothetical protein
MEVKDALQEGSQIHSAAFLFDLPHIMKVSLFISMALALGTGAQSTSYTEPDSAITFQTFTHSSTHSSGYTFGISLFTVTSQ